MIHMSSCSVKHLAPSVACRVRHDDCGFGACSDAQDLVRVAFLWWRMSVHESTKGSLLGFWSLVTRESQAFFQCNLSPQQNYSILQRLTSSRYLIMQYVELWWLWQSCLHADKEWSSLNCTTLALLPRAHVEVVSLIWVAQRCSWLFFAVSKCTKYSVDICVFFTFFPWLGVHSLVLW